MLWKLWFTLFFIALPCAVAEVDITKPELIKIIRSAESSIQNLELNGDYREYKQSDEGPFEETGYRVNYEGIVTPGLDSMFKVHYTGSIYTANEGETRRDVTNLSDLTNLAEQEQQGSYNREIAMAIMYRPESDVNVMRKAYLMKEPNRNGVMLEGNGLSLTLPFFQQLGGIDFEHTQQYGLAYYLDNISPEWGEWTIVESDLENCIAIRVPYSNPELSDIIEIDLARGANIVRATMTKNYGEPEEKTIGALDHVKLEQFDGFWLPVEAQRTVGKRRVMKASFEYKNINAPLGPEDFVLDIPEGIAVFDSIAGTSYFPEKPQLLISKASNVKKILFLVLGLALVAFVGYSKKKQYSAP